MILYAHCEHLSNQGNKNDECKMVNGEKGHL